MRRAIIFLFLLVSFFSFAQRIDPVRELVNASSSSIDLLNYRDPDFSWNMEGKAQAELNDGINYLKEGKPNLAIPRLDAALKHSPDLWISYYYMGIALKQRTEFAPALYALRKADKLESENFYIQLELGKVSQLQNNLLDARQFYDKAQKLNPASSLPGYLIGNLLLSTNNFAAAKNQYQTCLKLDRMALDAEVKLGVIALLDKQDNAVAIFDRVLQKDSMHRQALMFHGLVAYEENKSTSLKDWNKLIRIEPGNGFFRMMRGVIETELAMYDEAFSDIRKFVEQNIVDENKFTGSQNAADKLINMAVSTSYVMTHIYGLSDADAARVRKAYCLLAVGDLRNADAAINQIPRAYNSALCIYLKGLIYEHSGQHEQAYKFYSTAISLDNDIADAHKKRGIYLQEMNKWDKAKADFLAMLRINNELYYAYRLIGVCDFNLNDFQGAVKDFSMYLAKDSTNVEVLGYRGVANDRTGNILAAAEDFLKIKRVDAIKPFHEITALINKMLIEGDSAKALNWTRRLYQADDSFKPAEDQYLETLILLERWDEVEKWVTLWIENIKPEKNGKSSKFFPDRHAYVFSIEGAYLYGRGEFQNALSSMNKSIRIDNKNSFSYLWRGKVQLKLNNVSAATKDLKKAGELGNLEALKLLSSL